MPRYYHVTKLDRVKDIQRDGLKPSSGIAAGGMSADSQSAYQYAEQDRGLVYMWTDIDYTGGFKTEKHKYALIVVDVEPTFDAEHIDVTKFAKAQQKKKTDENNTTVVCNAPISTIWLSYYPTDPAESQEPDKGLRKLNYWGRFNMAKNDGKGGKDDEIWEGDV